jgi:hypothetical protein
MANFENKNNLKKSKGWKLYFQIIFFIVFGYIYYNLGFSITFIVFIFLILMLLKLLKGKFYKRLNKFMISNFHFLSKQKKWVKKLIIILVFIIIYLLFKQIIFLILKQFGINVKAMLANKINQSMATQ